LKKLFTLLAFLLLAAAEAKATTWHVAKTGSDSNTCTQAQNVATPKLTITGASGGLSCLSANPVGNTLYIRAGTYSERVSLRSLGGGFTLSGATNRATGATISGYPDDAKPVINGNGSDFILLTDTESNWVSIKNLVIDGEKNPARSLGTLVQLNGTGPLLDGLEIMRAPTLVDIDDGGTGYGTLGILSGSDQAEIRNCSIHDNDGQVGISTGDGYAIYHTGTNLIMENCDLYSNGGYAIHNYNSGSTSVSNNTYRSLRIWGNNKHGLNPAQLVLGSGSNNRIYNSIIRDPANPAGGVQVDHACTNCLVANNVIDGHTGAAVDVSNANSVVSGTIIKNNILFGNTSTLTNTGTSTTFQNNDCFGNTTNTCTDLLNGGATGGATNITTNPRFVDAPNADFRLCTANGVPHANCTEASPAVDAGVNLGTIFTTDFAGSTRAAPWDMGAYESGSGGNPNDPTPALVLQISCDNVVTDSSGNSNNGTLTNGATYTSSGKYNQACSFDGTNDYVAVADSNSLDLTHGFTIEAWVYPTSSITDFAAILVKNYVYYLYAGSSGYCGAGGVLAGYDTGSASVNPCYATALTANTWTHVAATYDRTTLTIYISGNAVSSLSGSAFMPAGTGTLQIGASQFGEYFPGRLDEIRVYNYARNAAQIVTDRDTPINSIPATPFLTIGASATGMKLGASATATKIQGATQ
jgi:hypothetical protein